MPAHLRLLDDHISSTETTHRFDSPYRHGRRMNRSDWFCRDSQNGMKHGSIHTSVEESITSTGHSICR